MNVLRRSRGDRDLLLVPVLPGTVFRGPAAPARRVVVRRRLAAGAAVAVVLGAVGSGVYLLARGPGSRQAATLTAPAASVHPVTTAAAPAAPAPKIPKPKPAPSPAQQARAAARRLAARLPVALESAALLQVGGSVYVVGGTVHGKPTDGVWRIDLAGRRVRPAGHFIEPLADSAAARSGGVLYLAGGWTGEKVATAVLRWTPSAGSSLVARLPSGVRGARASFAGGKLYVTGGSPGASYEVDVGAGTVTTAATVPGAAKGGGTNLAFLARTLIASRSR